MLAGKSEKISDTDGWRMYWWIKGSLVVIALCCYFFVLDLTDYILLKRFLFVTFILALGFDAFMDWKYMKGSKEYLISLLLLAVGIIFFCVFIF